MAWESPVAAEGPEAEASGLVIEEVAREVPLGMALQVVRLALAVVVTAEARKDKARMVAHLWRRDLELKHAFVGGLGSLNSAQTLLEVKIKSPNLDTLVHTLGTWHPLHHNVALKGCGEGTRGLTE